MGEPTAVPPPSITLHVRVPGEPDRTVTLNGPVVTVGRDPRSRLCLDHDAIARRHAVFDVDAHEGWRLVDLGSGQITLARGDGDDVWREMGNRHVLRVGNRLHFGGPTGVIVEVYALTLAPAAPAGAPEARQTATAAVPVDLVGALRVAALRGVARLVRWARAIEREDGGRHG